MKTINTISTGRTLRALLAFALILCAATVPAIAADGVVNINTADQETLELLPRVGAAVAQRIVEYREQHGKFAHTTDLMLVRGVGEKTFDLMENYVVIEGQSTLAEKVRVPRAPKADSTSGESTSSKDSSGDARQ